MRAAHLIVTTGLLSAALALDSAPASAEGISAGGGFVYGTEIEELGIQLNGYYDLGDVVENLRVGGDFTYFFAPEGLTYWTLNANGHYIFLRPDALMVYGLAGLNLSHVSIDLGFVTASDDEIGLNLGAGLEYSVVEQLGLYAEIKYVISEANQAVLGAGARYRF
jgi:opacity protein-like surface antigen